MGNWRKPGAAGVPAERMQPEARGAGPGNLRTDGSGNNGRGYVRQRPGGENGKWGRSIRY